MFCRVVGIWASGRDAEIAAAVTGLTGLTGLTGVVLCAVGETEADAKAECEGGECGGVVGVMLLSITSIMVSIKLYDVKSKLVSM